MCKKKCTEVSQGSCRSSVIRDGHVDTWPAGLMDRLPTVLHVLHDIDTENSGERSVDARGLLTQLDLSFVSLLATFRRLLGDAKLLSDTLQSPSLGLSMAVDLVNALNTYYTRLISGLQE